MQDYRDVIIRPVITEKTMKMNAEHNQVTFEVPKSVNKIEIREAVEHLFGVKVKKVNTSNTKAKPVRRGVHKGTKSGYKKAIVTLAEGNTIDLFGDQE